MGDFLRPIIARFQEFFSGVGDGQSKLAPVIAFIQGVFIPGIMGIVTAFQNLIAVVRPIVAQIVSAILTQWGKIQPQVRAIWTSVQNIIKSALNIIKGVIQVVTGVIKGIWQNFGATILRFITTTMRNIANLVRSMFKVIEGIFKVVSSALRGDWKGMWDGIKQILSGALGIIKALLSQAWNVIKTITSAAWTAVKLLVSKAWDGIKAAVTAGVNGVVTLVKSIPGKITAALSGLGSLLVGAGKAIIQGLLDGIESMIGAVTDKLGKLTDMIPDWKGPRERDKKLLRPAGQLIIEGLVAGFQDGFDGVEKSLGKVTDAIEKALDKRYDGKLLKRHTKLVLKSLRDEYKALVKNGKAQDRLREKTKKSREALADLRKSSADYAKGISNSAISYASVVGLDTAFNSDAMLAKLRHKLAKLRQFASVVASLVASGLNQTMVDQIAAAGVEGGLATALAIQQGGQEAINEFNALQTEINGVAGDLGQTAADSMYAAGIKAAEGLIKGLEARAGDLDKFARKLAQSLAKAVKKALGINSPSRVFQDIGKQTVMGLRIGLDETYVKRAGANLANALTTGFASPGLTASAAYSGSANGGASTTNTYQITVKADATTDQAALGRNLTKAIEAYERAGGRRRA